MKTIIQSEVSECGLACCAMIASAHGQEYDLVELRQKFPSSLKGSSLNELIECLSALGMSSRAVKLDTADLQNLSVPCILHWNLNHFVVLNKVTRNKIFIVDPAVGSRVIRLQDAGAHFTGVALEVARNANLAPRPVARRLTMAQLTSSASGLTSGLAKIVLVAAVLEVFALMMPLMNQVIVDDVISSGDRDLLTTISIGFALLLTVQTMISWLRAWMVLTLSRDLSLQWGANFFSHLVRLPLDFFQKRHVSDISSRLGSISAIQRTLTTTVIESILDGGMALAAVVMMLIYSTLLTGLTVGAIFLYVLLRVLSYKALREVNRDRLVLSSRQNSHFLETVRAMTAVKLFSRELHRHAQWQNQAVAIQNKDTQSAKFNAVFANANMWIFGLDGIILFWVGANMVMSTQDSRASGGVIFTVGMLLAFMSYKTQFTVKTIALVDNAIEILMLGVHLERLSDITFSRPEPQLAVHQMPDNVEATGDSSADEFSVELRNVSFRYAAGGPWVLRGVNVSFPIRATTAIVGPSGCGKSTLIKILVGLIEPTSGDVLINGMPIRGVSMVTARRLFGVVMQDDLLLSGTILDNVTFSESEPDMKRVRDCLAQAELTNEVGKMPMGLYSYIGDMGAGLSGGQRQRLLLARALYKRPRCLVLDEATSHLDAANEHTVACSINRLALTRIIVAHRPETIASADFILNLPDCRLIQQESRVAA